MSYREPLPDDCPPADAGEIAGQRIVYRLVRTNPPTNNDFRSQRAEKPNAVFNGVSECQARGLSVFSRRRDAVKQLSKRRFRGWLVCTVTLDTGAGQNPSMEQIGDRIILGGQKTVLTFWLTQRLSKMKTIRATEILDYYDGIEIFAGLDEVGSNYLGLRIDTSGDHDRYAVVGVRPESLRAFRSGALDLRNLMLETPGSEWYVTVADMEYGEQMHIEPQGTPLEQSEYLPLPGFTLDE